MAAMNTRCYVAAQQDYYLCPLPTVQMPKEALQNVAWTRLDGMQSLTLVYCPLEKEIDKPKRIADSFC